MGRLLSVSRLGPQERLYGGAGILMRFKPISTGDSPTKSDSGTSGPSPNGEQAPSASDPMLPAMNGLEQALKRKAAQVMAQQDPAQSKAPGSTTPGPSGKR